MQRQLAKWGLTLEDAGCLGWEEIPQLHEPGLPSVRCIRIPYIEPLNGGSPVTAINGQDFQRFRVLPHILSPSDKPANVDMPKYLQPPETGVEAYYPPLIDWKLIDSDTSIPVLITEGEAKAARACKDWFPTIGLGGVNSFRSLKNGIMLCRTLRDFEWRGRKVYIIFDSDITDNPNVCAAANQLALTLVDHSAIPYMVFIPPVEDKKVGLDDFLISNGPDMLDALLNNAMPVTAVEALIRLNDYYYVVKDIASIYDLRNEKVISRGNFTTVVEAAEKSIRYRVTSGGKTIPEVVCAADEWLRWPMRNEAKSLVYEPGKDKLVEGSINVWPGWGCQPRKGSVRLFEQLVNFMFGEREDDKRWFMQWLAYPLQHPGFKLYTAAVLYSVEHGTGKSFLGEIVGKIYGKNFTIIQNKDFSASFNTWAKNRQFILGDEVTSSDRRAESDNLKKLITASEIRINEKYVEEYAIRDCINYLFTTNHPDAFFLEDSDRRFFIHEITTPKLTNEFYMELHDWVFQENGHECVFDYLLKYDLTGFNPRASAKETLAKVTMFESGLGDLASWLRNVIRDPENRLVWQGTKITKDIFSASELYQIYDPQGRTRVTVNGVSRELQKANIRPLLGSIAIQTPNGREKVYAMRNRNAWENADGDAVRNHVKAQMLGSGMNY